MNENDIKVFMFITLGIIGGIVVLKIVKEINK